MNKKLTKIHNESSSGYLSGIFAFLFWGFVPLYWKQLKSLPAFEIMSFRIISALFMILLVLILKKEIKESINLLKKKFFAILISALLVGTNWLVYVWAVNSGYIVETSLGYFINPLFNVFLGVIFLKERPRFWQWISIVMALTGVAYLGFQNIGRPWIAIAVAGSFALYGFVRKKLNANSLACLGAENIILLPVALTYLIYIYTNQSLKITFQPNTVIYFTLACGITTILPLAAFGHAVKHLQLTTVGIIQYLAPTFQLLIAVYVYNEPFTLDHKITFSFIWTALMIFTGETLIYSIRSRALVRKIL